MDDTSKLNLWKNPPNQNVRNNRIIHKLNISIISLDLNKNKRRIKLKRNFKAKTRTNYLGIWTNPINFSQFKILDCKILLRSSKGKALGSLNIATIRSVALNHQLGIKILLHCQHRYLQNPLFLYINLTRFLIQHSNFFFLFFFFLLILFLGTEPRQSTARTRRNLIRVPFFFFKQFLVLKKGVGNVWEGKGWIERCNNMEMCERWNSFFRFVTKFSKP